MQISVIGDASQAVVAQMTIGDEIRAEIASMVLLSDGVVLEAASQGMAHASAAPAVNSHVSLTHFRCMANLGVVTFAGAFAGEARHLDIRGGAWLCARSAFLFCSRDVIAVVGLVHHLNSSAFGADGCVLYRLSGHGDAYVHCGGGAIEYDLVAGQRVSVDAPCVAAYQETVEASIETIEGLTDGRGVVEPVQLMTLTGPGKIVLATLPRERIRTGYGGR